MLPLVNSSLLQCICLLPHRMELPTARLDQIPHRKSNSPGREKATALCLIPKHGAWKRLVRLVRVVGRCKWPRCNSVSSTMGKTRKTKKIGLKKILAKTDMRLKANQEAAAEEKKKKGAVRNLYVARGWLWRWAMFRMHTRTPRAAALPCQAEALSKPLLRV